MIFDRIKEVREELGYATQEDFSKAISIPNRTLQSYEQGKVKNIPHSFIEKLNAQYNVSFSWLLTGNGVIFEKDESRENSSLNYKNLIVNELDNLSEKQKEYYYHKIKADVLENEIKY